MRVRFYVNTIVKLFLFICGITQKQFRLIFCDKFPISCVQTNNLGVERQFGPMLEPWTALTNALFTEINVRLNIRNPKLHIRKSRLSSILDVITFFSFGLLAKLTSPNVFIKPSIRGAQKEESEK